MNFQSRFDAFHEQATQATGLSDFGPTDYHEGLRRLLADYDRYPRFSDAGAEVTAAEVVGRLAGRLMAYEGFKRFPQFTDTAIQRPLILLGMPRTGSTALHKLITQDPATQALELWLAAMPMPRPPRATWESNPVYRQVAAQFTAMLAANPTIQRIHPLFADQPDECRFVTDQTFWSPGMSTSATAPDYGRWAFDADARYTYHYLRRVMGLIAGGDKRRWVLKNPDHIWALDAVLGAFPDACIVQTHRDLAISLPSVVSLSWEILRTREPHKTLREQVRMSKLYVEALEKVEVIRAKADPGQVFDVHVDELHADQVGVAERIYAHFGFPLSEAARAAWRSRAAQDPKAAHGAHEYKLADIGKSAEEIYAMAPRYRERYARLYDGR
jgi:Sulfotransferase family